MKRSLLWTLESVNYWGTEIRLEVIPFIRLIVHVLLKSSEPQVARRYACGPPAPRADSCSLAQVYVSLRSQRRAGKGCVSLISLPSAESCCYCNYFVIFPLLCDLAASFFPHSLPRPSHTHSHSFTRGPWLCCFCKPVKVTEFIMFLTDSNVPAPPWENDPEDSFTFINVQNCIRATLCNYLENSVLT